MTPWPNNQEGGGRHRPPKIERSVLIFSAIAIVVLTAAAMSGRITGERLLALAVLIPSVILHEISHGLLANIYGDDTAKRAGRLTLNPLRHLDTWGTFIIPGALALSGLPPIGYAKPVPVNTRRMSRNRQMFVGLVGPATNIVIALIAVVGIYLIPVSSYLDPMPSMLDLLLAVGVVNVILAVFNLIPLPPLDGSSVVERFLPSKYWESYLKFRQYSMIILLILMLLASNEVYEYVFLPATNAWFDLLPYSVQVLFGRT